MPTQPATVARCRTGTWSGMAALRLAYWAFWNRLKTTHSRATPATVCCTPSSSSDTAPSSAAISVPQSRSRPVVRSDMAPATGVAMVAAMAPAADTRPSARILCAGVMSCSWIGMSTWIGVSAAIHMPRLAKVRPVIQPLRTYSSGSASALEIAPASRSVEAMAGSCRVAGHMGRLTAMRITVIGCSGSFPGPASPASCYLVEADGFRLLLDLGNSALGALQNHAPLDGIGAVCLSHLHGDHCLDMCSYAVARTYAPGGAMPPLPVWAPAGAAERLAQAQGTNISDGIAR